MAGLRGAQAGLHWRLASVLLFAAFLLAFGTFGFRMRNEMLLATALGAVAVLLFADRQTRDRMPISVTLVSLMCWISLSVTWSDAPSLTLRASGGIVLLVVAISILASVSKTDVLFSTLVWAVRFTVILTLVVVIVRPESRLLIDPSGRIDDLPGWRGPFLHKNFLGPFLAVAAITTLCFDRRPLAKSATLLIIGVLLIGSRSVTGITGTIVALGTWVWLHADTRFGGPRSTLRRASFALGTLGVVAALASASTLASLVGKDGTFSGRTTIWGAVMGAWAERPVLGFGLRGVLDPSSPTSETIALWRDIRFEATHAHNGLLSVGVQLGLIGVLLLLAFLGSTLIDAFRVRSADPGLANWIIPLMAALLFISLSEAVFLISPTWLGMLVVFKVILLRRKGVLAQAESFSAVASPAHRRDSEEPSMDLAFIVAALRRHALVVVLFWALGTVLALGLGLWSQDRYESRVVLSVPPTTESNTYAFDHVVLLSGDALAQKTSAAVRETLGQDISPADVQRIVTIEHQPFTETVIVVASDSDPDLVRPIAIAHVDGYLQSAPLNVSEEQRREELEVDVAALADELATLNERIDAALATYESEASTTASAIPTAEIAAPEEALRRELVATELEQLTAELINFENTTVLQNNSTVSFAAPATPTRLGPKINLGTAAAIPIGVCIGVSAALLAARGSSRTRGTAARSRSKNLTQPISTPASTQ